ncbi:hypothetical protein D1867_11840 [Acidianus infernus]|uniref:Uncharacterized protein n=1 Tax=Acidianus infernus TaxID=12915 RepID=A0A6A9QF37_ACIIN|nr:hypothetical protein [Acidianus infernus]
MYRLDEAVLLLVMKVHEMFGDGIMIDVNIDLWKQ